MPGKLTTHVLDTSTGRPAAGVKVSLYRGQSLLREMVTNADGRGDRPLLEGVQFLAGTYRLEFAVGDYFASMGQPDTRRFLDVVPIVFVVDDPMKSYHVPLLVTPWSYSTYRGS
jgi:5-hydroxyisourate hydrolase